MGAEEARKTDYSGCMQNRELSWLMFNERVLEEANFPSNPPLERLKFISIFSSNLDEFYRVRVGTLVDYMLYAPDYRDTKTGMTAKQQLDEVYARTLPLCSLKDIYFDAVTEDLFRRGVRHLKMRDLDKGERMRPEQHFTQEILPFLSPQIIDNHHPFPHIDNKRLHVAVRLEHKGKGVIGLIAMPTALDRCYFPERGGGYLLLEDIVCHYSHLAFEPYAVRERTVMAVTRSADIDTEDDATSNELVDYRQFMQKLIRKRRRLAPVRLELQNSVDGDFMGFLCARLNLKEKQVFVSSAPLDLSYCFRLEDTLEPGLGRPLARPAHVPVARRLRPAKAGGLLKAVQKKDVLFSFPFDSMSPFLEAVRIAAEDPAVISIQITLYRIGSQSKLAESLIRAADNGKEVTVIMELRARFDEENNIEWSQRLDEAGCRVIYGLSGYKVHSKICLITRKESGRLQRVTQIGTGNYNEKTVRQYTDLSLMTADRRFGEDAAAFFNNLLLGRHGEDYTHLWVAPNCFKSRFLQCLEQERRKAEGGLAGRVVLKCNAFTDGDIIRSLIEASQCGVRISMIVRGSCCLIPRVPGLTDNISIISIVGRFLEHSRIFCFGTGADRKVFISSADLMTRNTGRRVEIACPVLDPDLRDRICEMLETMLEDNTKAWELFPDGRYVLRRPAREAAVDSQEIFIEQARALAAASAADGERSAIQVSFPRAAARRFGRALAWLRSWGG
ncbi:MAG: polyphosphate kinase 1 [Deltaproteobacteria bacterium]|jgi:polyphosphate kinase|nr:polyphosphate kinase 1 [Deltaproteobacteria bacterium]